MKLKRDSAVKFLAVLLLLIFFGHEMKFAGQSIDPETNSVVNVGIFQNTIQPAACPGPGLLISEILTNPAGNDSPFEFVELRATRAINFAVTPYSVVFNNNGTANANGWVAGGTISYGFNITTGTVNAGDIVYVGGSSMVPTGPKLRTINTATTAGDGFGSAAAGGVLGNGGANADGVAVSARSKRTPAANI